MSGRQQKGGSYSRIRFCDDGIVDISEFARPLGLFGRTVCTERIWNGALACGDLSTGLVLERLYVALLWLRIDILERPNREERLVEAEVPHSHEMREVLRLRVIHEEKDGTETTTVMARDES